MRFEIFLLSLLACSVFGAERSFNFSQWQENAPPPGFRSTVTGQGKPGNWRIILDEAAPALPGLPHSPEMKQAVLAQLAQDPADEHFPLLIYEGEVFDDFTLTTQFKTVSGKSEQMAGIAFRIQNETNYYVVRASSLGNTFRFYKVVDGQRGVPVGPEMPIPAGTWHEMTLECKGEQIRCLLNGKEVVSVRDKVNAFMSGKVGYWTKSDSVSYFKDTKLVYKPHVAPAQVLVTDMLKRKPGLLDLKIYAVGAGSAPPRLIASREEKEIGQPAGKNEQDVIRRGVMYYGKEKGKVSVTMPLRDRNGENIAAACVVMKSFLGQTELNAVTRAAPVVKELQEKVQGLQDLME